MQLVGDAVGAGQGHGRQGHPPVGTTRNRQPRGPKQQHPKHEVLAEVRRNVHDVGIFPERGSCQTHQPALDRSQGARAREIAARMGRHEEDERRPQGDEHPGEYELSSLGHGYATPGANAAICAGSLTSRSGAQPSAAKSAGSW